MKISKLVRVGALKLSFLIISLIISVNATPVQSQVIMPDSVLIEHIKDALRNNPGLASWQNMVEAASEKVPQAGAWADPTLKLSLMNLPFNSFDFNQEPMTAAWITAGQAIPLAGKPAIKTEIAEYGLETTEAGRRTQELKVAENIAQIWYDWAYLREALLTLNRNINLLDDLIVVAMRKYETGKGLQQDILRSETIRTRLEDMRVKLQQMIITTGRRFAVLLGHHPDVTHQPPKNLTENFRDLEIDELSQRLFEDNPAWQRMRAELAASKSRVDLAKSSWWPDLKLGAAYGYRQDADNGMERPDFFTATAAVSIPLYGKRKQGAAVQEKRAMQRATAAKQRSLELDLRLKLEKLLDEDNRLEEQIRLYREGVEPQAEATLTASTASYSVGKADFEALLMAETALYNAQLERLARVRDRLQVRASLAALIGGDNLISGALRD